jgi:hypothetical protein
MNAIVPIPSGTSLPAALAPDLTRAAEWAREEKAAATRRAYRSDFRIFDAWCGDRGVSALPAAPEGYVHGPQPTSVDAGIYGFIANIYFYGIDTTLKQFVCSHRNLVRHCTDIHAAITA